MMSYLIRAPGSQQIRKSPDRRSAWKSIGLSNPASSQARRILKLLRTRQGTLRPIWALLLLLLIWTYDAHAGKKTICTITVNSSDEKKSSDGACPLMNSSSSSWWSKDDLIG